MLSDRRHVFYAHVVKGSRITRKSKAGTQGRTILKLVGTPGRDTLYELLNAATPVCFEVTFFIPDEKRRSL